MHLSLPAARRWAVLIALAGSLTYANSLANPFVYDDQSAVVQNGTIRTISPFWSALRPPLRSTPTAGRPVVNLSLAINYALGGLDPSGYHVWNVTIHVLCALVLFGLVRRTLALPGGTEPDAATPIAATASLIWMVHPLQSEAAAYVSARTESMMALCYLLTLYCAVRALDPKRKPIWTLAAVASCAIGMACKESMLTAPAMLVLYDRVFAFRSMRESLAARWPLYVGVFATSGIAVGLMIAAPRGTSAGFTPDPRLVQPITAWVYLLNQSVMIAHYLRLMIWPAGLVLDYGLPRPLTVADVWPYMTLIGLLVAGTAVALWRWPPLGFVGAWFFVTLAPASSFVPVHTEVGAERRMYLPAVALVVAAVVAGYRWSQHARVPRSVRVALVTGLAAALAVGTALRNREYASPLTLWRTVVDRWPHGRARYHLALELQRSGRREEAMPLLREALSDFPEAHFGIGSELLAQRNYPAAIAELEAFITARPMHLNVIDAREMIGLALAGQGRSDAAIEQFREILRMTPRYVNAHARIADVFFAQRKYAEAAEEYGEYLAVRPDQPGAWTNYAISLSADGHGDESIRAFERVVALTPQNAGAHRNLANALLQRPDFDAAAKHAREAIRLAPDDAIAHDLLGLALLGTQHRVEAAAEFRAAIALDPAYADAREHLEAASRR